MTVHHRESPKNFGGGQSSKQIHTFEWAPIPEEEEIGTQTVTLDEYRNKPVRTL